MTLTVATTMRSIRDPESGELRDSLSRDWIAYLDGLGYTVIPVPNDTEEPATLLETASVDGLILTNGEDVGAHLPRDRTEATLVDAARDRDLPILGVCRGHQFLNHHFGGKLVRIDEVDSSGAHAGTIHDVNVVAGPLADALPSRLKVNSYHNWGITIGHVAEPLRVFARHAPLVEGLYHPDAPIMSIQWHPEREMPEPEPVNRLVTNFLEGRLRW